MEPDFFARPAEEVAVDLIGCTLRTTLSGEVTAGKIVEVEAYIGPEDPAAHGYGGRRTARNSSMFGPAGSCYVYFIYGMHWCFNTVTGPEGFPAAVLIRALEPAEGIDVMKARRGIDRERLLCAGPARLCQALGIDGSLDGRPLPTAEISVAPRIGEPVAIATTARIGITRAVDWPLRFAALGSGWLSR